MARQGALAGDALVALEAAGGSGSGRRGSRPAATAAAEGDRGGVVRILVQKWRRRLTNSMAGRFLQAKTARGLEGENQGKRGEEEERHGPGTWRPWRRSSDGGIHSGEQRRLG